MLHHEIINQGCALAETGGPLCLTFPTGRLEYLTFFMKYYNSYTGQPGFHRFRSLGSLQFFSEHSFVKEKNSQLRITITKT